MGIGHILLRYLEDKFEISCFLATFNYYAGYAVRKMSKNRGKAMRKFL